MTLLLFFNFRQVWIVPIYAVVFFPDFAAKLMLVIYLSAVSVLKRKDGCVQTELSGEGQLWNTPFCLRGRPAASGCCRSSQWCDAGYPWVLWPPAFPLRLWQRQWWKWGRGWRLATGLQRQPHPSQSSLQKSSSPLGFERSVVFWPRLITYSFDCQTSCFH